MFQEVQNFIVKKIDVKPEMVQLDTQLVNLGVDSMKLIMMIMDFENEFGVKISDRQLETIYTVEDLVNLIKKDE